VTIRSCNYSLFRALQKLTARCPHVMLQFSGVFKHNRENWFPIREAWVGNTVFFCQIPTRISTASASDRVIFIRWKQRYDFEFVALQSQAKTNGGDDVVTSSSTYRKGWSAPPESSRKNRMIQKGALRLNNWEMRSTEGLLVSWKTCVCAFIGVVCSGRSMFLV